MNTSNSKYCDQEIDMMKYYDKIQCTKIVEGHFEYLKYFNENGYPMNYEIIAANTIR